jgi:hypothetical protein
MPRTVPSGITALQGVAATRAPILLLKLALSGGTVYYSSAETITYGGNTYLANRIHSVGAFDAAYIDRKTNDSQKLEIEIDNVADNGSATFPLTALNASQSFEDAKATVYLYSPDASDAVLAWFGFVQGCTFSGGDKYCTISASFFWDSLDLQEPPLLLQAKGFQQQEAAAKTGENQDDALPVPLIYGAGPLRVWPIIYNHWTDGYNFHVEFVLSGIQSGQPFNVNDVQAASMQLFGVTNATTVEFYPGNQVAAPANLTRFPESNAHLLCAFGYAVFPITAQIKDRLDDVKAQDLRLVVQNGRPLARTSLPSENGPLILEDMMRDPVFGTGLSSALFDSTVLTATANYVGTRYQLRYELAKQLPFGETVQRILSDFHGFITFDDGLIQIRCKKNTESSVATFATIDSGHTARKIHNDFVDVTIKDSSELINQVTLKYRRKTKNRRIVTLYDPNAQIRAGGTAKKVVELVIDESDSGGLYDETQAQINCAIIVREEQNGNLFISFQVPIWDGIDVSPGDVITVWSPDIINNGSNNLFRVTKQSIDHAACLISFECQVYKTAIYNDDASALGVDLLRGGEDTNAQGRPPDVVPVSLTVIDVVANDTEGKDATLRAIFTVPAYDPTANNTAGLFPEPPIAEVEIEWHYTDEPVQASRFGGALKVTQQASAFSLQIDFVVPYFKSRSVEAFFVSIGANRSRVPLGLIPDPTKITTISGGNLSATAATAGVVATGGNFNPNDYVQIEKEQDQVLSKTPTSITFVNVAGVRTPLFGTVSIGHPNQTEVAVLKQSYPSLIRSLLTPRFTYATVTLLNLLQRGGDGVRAQWTDVSPDNLEEYLIYWSTDADAGTNVAKLGSASPAWYLSDPFTLPSGVNLSRTNRQQHYLIPQENIGVIGTPVFVRVAARNGKKNFSSTLSNLLNSSVIGGGVAAPTDAPSTPTLADVIINTSNPGTGGEARIVLRIYADVTRTKTFSAVGTIQVIPVLDTGGTKLWKPVYNIEDGSVTFVDVALSYALAGVLTWTGNRSWSAGGHKDSAVSSVLIAAGGFQTNIAGITNPAIASISAVDDKHSYITYSYGQPNPPVLLAYAAILRQLPGEPGFLRETKFDTQNESGFMTPGTIQATTTAKHPKKVLANWKLRLGAVDGSFVDSPTFSQTTPDVDTGPPNNGTAITLTHAAVKNGRTLIVRFTLPTLQMVSHVRNTLIIHDNNFTGAGRRFFDPVSQTWVATYTDGTTEIDLAKGGVPSYNTPLSALQAGGRTTIYVKIGVYNAFNGGSVIYSTDAPGVGVVGNIPLNTAGAEPADGDTAAPTLASPSAPLVQEKDGAIYCSAPPPTGNIKTLDQIRFIMSTQATPPVSANPTIGSEGVVTIKHGDTVTFRPQRPQPVTLYFYYEARNQFNGGTYSVWSTGTSLDPSGISRPLDDVIGSDVPSLAMVLERSATSGTGHSLTTFVLDAGASGTPLFYFASPPMILHVPSLSAVDAVRNIVGYNSASKTVSIDTPFSAVPANSIPFEIHRGITLGGKSGNGHSLTAFVLPATASAVDGTYNGYGLYIPSAAVGQKIQKVISYVGVTRTCTIEKTENALTSAPANGCGFLLSQGTFGYASSNATGIIAPVPFRLWFDGDTLENVVETIPPSGENAYSLTFINTQWVRQSNQVVRGDVKLDVNTSPVMRFKLASVPTVRQRLNNRYRKNSSDGYSAWSYYAVGFASGGSAPTTTYLPGTYLPPEGDIYGIGNLPHKYPAY